MKNFKYALPLSIALALIFAQGLTAQPPQALRAAAVVPSLAPAPGGEPYGWWYSKTPDPFSRRGGGASHALTGGPAPVAGSGQQTAQADSGAQGRPAGERPPRMDGKERPEGPPPEGRPAGGRPSKADGQGHPQGPPPEGHPTGGRPPKADGRDRPQGPPPTDGASQSDNKASDVKVMSAGMPVSHSFARNSNPIRSLYLAVAGAEMPATAPEVYYRFTARTMERHGGVALGSSFHQAKVEREGDSWRADIFGASFGTVEVFSRFKLGDRMVYSQHNYLHFVRAEDSKDLKMPERAELPADWPQLVFPTSSYNDMAFRGTQAGQTVEFEVLNHKGKAEVAKMAVVLEENMPEAVTVGFSPRSKKFSYTAQEDPSLLEAGARASKQALALIELPGSGEILTFSLSVSRSRWSTRKLGLGLGAAAAMAAVTAIIVVHRRRRFKYNDCD